MASGLPSNEDPQCEKLRAAWHKLDDAEKVIGEGKELIEEVMGLLGCDPIPTDVE